MKNIIASHLVPAAMLLAVGCGARTPLDSMADQTDLGSGGYSGAGGGAGYAGNDGYPASGGAAGGAVFTHGGAVAATGGKGGSATYSGGLPSAGGAVFSYGGATPVSGGRRGGEGGSVDGGSIFGGSPSGGKGGGAGSPLGGSVGGSAGTTTRDAGVGGSAGSGGRDAGSDFRSSMDGPADSRPDGTADVRDAIGIDGNSCVGLASNEELIDDMNDGSRIIPKTNGRVGAWSDSDDGTPGGTMFPDPATPFTMTDTGDVCRKLAVYVKGGGFVDWGSSFSVGLGRPLRRLEVHRDQLLGQESIRARRTSFALPSPTTTPFPTAGFARPTSRDPWPATTTMAIASPA